MKDDEKGSPIKLIEVCSIMKGKMYVGIEKHYYIHYVFKDGSYAYFWYKDKKSRNLEFKRVLNRDR